MHLIIINGMPATGKTTIARSLSEQLNVPVIAKDTIKEFLFDTLGVKDRDWSRLLGGTSNDVLYLLADALLGGGQSIIMESSFERKFARSQIKTLIQTYHPLVTEIYCTTERTVRRKRFMERNQSGKRHAGHLDHTNYLADTDEEPIEKYSPLKFSAAQYIEIDTTDPRSVDIDTLATRLASS
jgi:predicted kinase